MTTQTRWTAPAYDVEDDRGAGTRPSSRALVNGQLYMYYRQPNGWITSGKASAIERTKFADEGWGALPQYGGFHVHYPWIANNPLTPLFQKGGAHELCLEQIIENGLHLNPPLVPVCGQILADAHPVHGADCWDGARTVHFPQLAGVPGPLLQPLACEWCTRIFPTKLGKEQHETVMHREERNPVKTGAVMSEALIAGLAPALAQAIVLARGGEMMPSPDPSAEASEASEALAALGGLRLKPYQLRSFNKAQVEAFRLAGMIAEEDDDGDSSPAN